MTAPPEWWVEALAKVAYGIRQQAASKVADTEKWDYPGIKAAILRVGQEASPVDTARVVCAGADNPQMKTPGAISEPGPQWAGTAQGSSKQRQRCPTHKVLLQAGDCPKCAEGLTRNRPDNFTEIYHQAMQAAREEREAQKREDMSQ